MKRRKMPLQPGPTGHYQAGPAAPGGGTGGAPPLVVVREPLGFRRLDPHLRLLPLGLVHGPGVGPPEEPALQGRGQGQGGRERRWGGSWAPPGRWVQGKAPQGIPRMLWGGGLQTQPPPPG